MNEVEITITGHDLSGPAFASAILHTKALQAAVHDLRGDLNSLAMPGLDSGRMMSSLTALKSKIQSLGIADIADVNVNPGQLMVQMNLLKRLINQAGISDLLDLNVNKAQITNQLSDISRMSASIPVNFDVSNLDTSNLPVRGLHVPINWDLAPLPKMGDINNISEKINIGASLGDVSALVTAQKGFRDLGLTIDNVQAALTTMDGSWVRDASLMADSRAAWRSLGSSVENAQNSVSIMDGTLLKAGLAATDTSSIIQELAAADSLLAGQNERLSRNYASLSRSQVTTAQAAKGLAGEFAAGIPLYEGASSWFGVLFAHTQLFGGALTAIGVPAMFATANGLHILIDAAIEAAAVIIPAAIAFAAFGIGATPVVMELAKAMKATSVTSQALGINIYPLTGGLQAMADAVQPEVYQLFGQALVVAQHNTGIFTIIAVEAGKALDALGARTAVALTGQGFGTFIREGAKDLAIIGDIIANIFGTIGNLLKVMPGYAQVLLGSLDAVTKGVESLTSSGIGQWAVGAFLAFHGFILWAGLAATAAVYFGNGLIGLAAKLGIAEEGMLSFNAVQFGTGIKTMIIGTGILAGEMVTLGAGEDIAAAGALVLEGAWSAITAINPLVWVGIAVAAIGLLVYKLVNARSATDDYVTSIQNSFNQVPISQLALSVVVQQADAVNNLAAAQKALGNFTQNQVALFKNMTAVEQDRAKATSATYRSYLQLNQTVADQKAILPVLNQDMTNYSIVLKAAGGNISLLNDAGISTNDIMNAGSNSTGHYTQAMKELIVRAQAAADAQNALALGTGREAAARNAQTNAFMTETLPAMQKVTQAEDNLLNVVIGGRVAFDNFQQSIEGTTAKFKSPSGLADAAALANGNLTGLGEQSLAFANTLYNISIPALQKTITSLDNQGISTSDLTKVVATGSGEMLQYVGHNAEARSVIVALINNALGPGTVSLQTLNKWVGSNSTSLLGMNSIVAKSTIAAGEFAGVLSNTLNIAMTQSIVDAYGGQKAFDTFAQGLATGQTQSTDFIIAGNNVIRMLERQSGGDVPKAKKAFEDYAMNGLGLTRGEADKLWNDLTGPGNHALATAGNSVDQVKNKFISYVHNGLNYTQQQGQNLWDSLNTQGRNALIALGQEADTVRNSHLSPLGLAIRGLPSLKEIQILEHAAATGQVTVSQGPGSPPIILSVGQAMGGLIDVGTTATADDVWLRASKGETVVSAKDSKTLAPYFAAVGVPGYAQGGRVGFMDNHIIQDTKRLVPWTAWAVGKDLELDLEKGISNAIKIAKAGIAASALAGAAAGAVAGGFGPATGGAAQAQAYARSRLGAYGWGQGQMPPLIALWNQESGWNRFAQNASSGAYGIPQALPFTKMPRAAWPAPGGVSSMSAQVDWGMGYIRSVYGSPAGAEGHERAFNWYDNGGWLRPGLNPPMYNGTGAWEHLTPDRGGNRNVAPNIIFEIAATGNSAFDAFMIEWMKTTVRIKGGGNVQMAFGRH